MTLMSGKTGIPGDPRLRLREAIEARAKRLRLTFAEVATLAGMTYQNLYRIRTGEIELSYKASDGIEDALQWTRGSIREVLAGGEPTAIDVPARPEAVETGTSADGEIDREMFDHLMLVKATMDASNASQDLKNKLIMAEAALWRQRLPDPAMFLRTWLRWVHELQNGGAGTEGDYPYQTG